MKDSGDKSLEKRQILDRVKTSVLRDRTFNFALAEQLVLANEFVR